MEKINDLKNSSESNSSEINMINDRINILGENVDKIIKIGIKMFLFIFFIVSSFLFILLYYSKNYLFFNMYSCDFGG